MNALTLRGIVAEELGSLSLHVIGKCGGLGELKSQPPEPWNLRGNGRVLCLKFSA